MGCALEFGRGHLIAFHTGRYAKFTVCFRARRVFLPLWVNVLNRLPDSLSQLPGLFVKMRVMRNRGSDFHADM
jgi:hypothetical protein